MFIMLDNLLILTPACRYSDELELEDAIHNAILTLKVRSAFIVPCISY